MNLPSLMNLLRKQLLFLACVNSDKLGGGFWCPTRRLGVEIVLVIWAISGGFVSSD